MDEETSTDDAISSASAAPDDCDIMEPKLPKLCATSICVCRKLVLQHALEALGFSMHETTTLDNETNEILTAIRIDVPPHIQIARMKTRLFYGDWSLTTDASVQSACFNVLVYLQKVHVLIIDGIHSAELKHCQRELLQKSSWAEGFEQHADKLQSQLSTIVKPKTPLLPVAHPPAKVNVVQETSSSSREKCIDAQFLIPSGPTKITENVIQKMHADDRLLAPSGPIYVPPTVLHQGASSGIPFVNLTENAGGPAVIFEIIGNPPFGRRKRKDPVPVPGPARAAFNRKKRKLIIGLRYSRLESAAVPNVPLLECSSSENIFVVMNDIADKFPSLRPDHVDPGCTVVSLSASSSIGTRLGPRTRAVALNSKVRKPLFQEYEDREEVAKSKDRVLDKTADLAEADEVLENTLVDLECCGGLASLTAAKKRKSQSAEGIASTSAMKAEP